MSNKIGEIKRHPKSNAPLACVDIIEHNGNSINKYRDKDGHEWFMVYDLDGNERWFETIEEAMEFLDNIRPRRGVGF